MGRNLRAELVAELMSERNRQSQNLSGSSQRVSRQGSAGNKTGGRGRALSLCAPERKEWTPGPSSFSLN